MNVTNSLVACGQWRLATPVARSVPLGCLLVWLPGVAFGIALAFGNFAGCELSGAEVRP